MATSRQLVYVEGAGLMQSCRPASCHRGSWHPSLRVRPLVRPLRPSRLGPTPCLSSTSTGLNTNEGGFMIIRAWHKSFFIREAYLVRCPLSRTCCSDVFPSCKGVLLLVLDQEGILLWYGLSVSVRSKALPPPLRAYHYRESSLLSLSPLLFPWVDSIPCANMVS